MRELGISKMPTAKRGEKGKSVYEIEGDKILSKFF